MMRIIELVPQWRYPEISPEMSRRIDVVRGFLCIYVFLGHLKPFFASYFGIDSFWVRFVTYGSLSVPVFFVLSGFLISHSYLKISSKNSSAININRIFYAKRFFRTIPVWLFCVITFLIVRNQFSLDSFLKTFFFSEVIVPNSFSQQIIPHSWSLYIEELFYLLFPLIWLGLRGYWRWLTLGATYFIGKHFEAYLNVPSDLIFHNPFFKFYFFFLGIYIYGYQKTLVRLPRLSISALIITTLLLLSWNKLNEAKIIFMVGFGFYFILSHSPQVINHLLLPLEKMGRLCYPFYLFHILALFYLPQLMNSFPPTWTPDTTLGFSTILIGSFLITLLFSLLTHYLIELPFIVLGRNLIGRLSHKN